MSRFYLKELNISGEGKTSSSIDFNRGLNIVYGVSDTGKTCIIKCIDYVFGNSKGSPLPEKHGYATISLLLETDNGLITLERTIGKNSVNIHSTDEAISSGVLNIRELGKVLLKLIGIDNSPTIVKNSRYEQISLTWRTFLHSFLIYENEVIQPEPILIAKESTINTASLSGLLYLIAAPDASLISPVEDKKIREARKNAVRSYISEEIDTLSKKKELLEKQLHLIEGYSIDEEIQRILDELTETERKISEEVNKCKGTLSQILHERDRLAECDLLLNRYEKLRSQYITDIKRLAFIVEGETNMAVIDLPNKCPFCNGDIQTKRNDSYIESANSELKRISRLLTELSSVEETVITDKNICIDRLSELNNERTETERFVKKELRPRAEKLKKMLDDYRTLVRMQKELELIEDLQKKKTGDYNQMLASTDDKAIGYKPREHFPIGFETDMTRIFENVLRECRYENLLSALFSLKDFDVIVNAKRKPDFGKGYRAFLNVTLAITMREYLCKYGKYSPGLLIVDSPLLSLEQGVNDSAPDSMKSGLIEYLMKTQSIGQTIIIENRIPELDYSKHNVKIHNFTKGKTSGRYGLLFDVFN